MTRRAEQPGYATPWPTGTGVTSGATAAARPTVNAMADPAAAVPALSSWAAHPAGTAAAAGPQQ
jgi:hypothetical protein